MPDLTLLHIEQISRDISNQEISFSHLLDDLIDHVCCDVEYEMQQGFSFPEAYRRVKQKMGFRRLKEIQEETLYAVDTKYRNMKNTMKISGVAGTILLGFAALFKIQHWPFASIMLTLGAVILAFVFMPSALGVIWKETHSRKRIFLLISAFLSGLFFIMGALFKTQHWPLAGYFLLIAGLSCIFLFIPALTISVSQDPEKKTKRPVYFVGALGIIFYVAGLLFKIQHWPFATLLLMAGMIFLCVIAFPWFTWITWRNDSHIRARFIFILIGSLALVLPGVLINLNLSGSYREGFYPHQEQQQALFRARYSSNLAILSLYRDSAASQLMGQVHSKTTGLLNLIGNIQTSMVAESEGKRGVPALKPSQIIQTEMGPSIQYSSLSDPFQIYPVYDFLLPGCSSRLELNKAISEYINFISSLTSGEQLQKYKAILDPSIFLPDESKNGTEISMMTGLLETELLKNSILTVESSILKSVARK